MLDFSSIHFNLHIQQSTTPHLTYYHNNTTKFQFTTLPPRYPCSLIDILCHKFSIKSEKG